jgi:predicted nucleic acid-binding protein
VTISIDQRYWDSAACLAYLLDESGRADQCELVLDAAEDGKLEVVVSALTIAEVLALRGKDPIPADRADAVRRFFRRDFFVVADVDRFIAEHARELVWGAGIKPKDAIHVATALSLDVPYLDTFDDGLIGKSGSVGGKPPLVICKPGFGMQGKLL